MQLLRVEQCEEDGFLFVPFKDPLRVRVINFYSGYTVTLEIGLE
jgi:hypothetical protein